MDNGKITTKIPHCQKKSKKVWVSEKNVVILHPNIKNMDEKLVSVIMPTYNGSRFLAASIESVLSQTYKHLELLITDDCSSDYNVQRIIKEYAAKDSRVKPIFLKKNHGVGYSRNNAIERAEGRYIAFCDSDDRWMPEKIEKQLAYMNEKGCALSYSSYILCDENDHEKGIVIAPQKVTYHDMIRDNKVGCSTAIYDIKKTGRKMYMPIMRKRQDWAFFITIFKQCQVSYGIQEPMGYYRIRKNSISSHKAQLIKYNVQVYRDILGYSKLRAYIYFFCMFMPTYTLKITKRQWDSYRYMHS